MKNVFNLKYNVSIAENVSIFDILLTRTQTELNHSKMTTISIFFLFKDLKLNKIY